jgi:hypothetical protein
MRKPSILFKSSAVTVQEIPSGKDNYGIEGRAVAIAGRQAIMLEAAAADLLVGYLRVVRAYFSGLDQPKNRVPVLLTQVVRQLEELLQQTGKSIAEPTDVSLLIERMGCMYDWVHWNNESLYTHP